MVARAARPTQRRVAFAMPPGNAQSIYTRIYDVVRRIPEGRVASYGQIAAMVGRPRHARQVGYALSALPDGSEVPWHRVINSRGEVSERSFRGLGGREGFQRHLLEEEGVLFNERGRVDLVRFRWEPDRSPQKLR